MRIILVLLLGAMAIFFALIGTMMPIMLSEQAAKDRAYYQQFERAAEYVSLSENLPSTETLRQLSLASGGPSISSSLTFEPIDCAPDFEKAPSDQFVLSFWRGEWSECYAYPSGKTTLHRTTASYLLSGFGIQILICWLLAAGATWGAIRLLHKRIRLADA
ncbi:hypothetical protein [Stakelama tenebrarum]|uniref:Uncharacterized protein n=1 Tax=Stakelama tenebrarum TaxID=2711215 RepID=A0A6G6Y887_9SPHN|nr:hypothetical protein [Sphingosinithalassobacter tenebrarum]QIG80786.1 hypothetical protein G5C33_13975 [Sphingosinithalassobacter tenebrarum]